MGKEDFGRAVDNINKAAKSLRSTANTFAQTSAVMNQMASAIQTAHAYLYTPPTSLASHTTNTVYAYQPRLLEGFWDQLCHLLMTIVYCKLLGIHDMGVTRIWREDEGRFSVRSGCRRCLLVWDKDDLHVLADMEPGGQVSDLTVYSCLICGTPFLRKAIEGAKLFVGVCPGCKTASMKSQD